MKSVVARTPALCAAMLMLTACDNSSGADSAQPPSTPVEAAAVAAAADVADGDWSCRAGAALVGELRISGADYALRAADGVSSGQGRLSGAGETLTILSGPLKTELGLSALVHHQGSEYPSLTGMNDLGAAMTCFHAE